MRTALAAAVVAATAFIGSSTGSAAATPARDIVFTRHVQGTGTGDVYTVDDDGTGLRRLAADGKASRISQNYDVVFTRHLGGTGVGDVYTVRGDGTGLRRLTTSRNNFDAVYSPDGRRIAFASDRGRAGAPELYVMDADGRNVRRVTRSRHGDAVFFINAQPVWAPDGRTIVFVRTEVRVKGSTETTDLWSVEPGKAPRRITSHPGREASPAFTSTGILSFERDGRIYRLQRGSLTPVTRGTEPAWAPDGGFLAFVRDGAVYVTLGGREREVADGTSPAWSPDGRRLVYSTIDGLYSLTVADGRRTRLTSPGYPRADLSPSVRR